MSADDAEVEALLERLTRARRRAKPRVTPAFYDAEDVSIETSFGQVQAWRLGEGPAVLCVHGWEDDHALWGPLIDTLSDIGRAVVAFDLPGHGFSQAEEASYHSAREAIALIADEMGPIDAIVAHSFGCVASVAALDAGLDVARAVIIASPLASKAGRGRRMVDGGEVSEETFARALALYKERTGRDYGGFDMEEALTRRGGEALVIHSIDDEQCPPENAQRIAELWPNAELVMADGLGHRLIAQDEDIIARIVQFVG